MAVQKKKPAIRTAPQSKLLVDPMMCTPDNLVKAVLDLHPDTQNEFLSQLLPQLFDQRQRRIAAGNEELKEANGQMEYFFKVTANLNRNSDSCCKAG